MSADADTVHIISKAYRPMAFSAYELDELWIRPRINNAGDNPMEELVTLCPF